MKNFVIGLIREFLAIPYHDELPRFNEDRHRSASLYQTN